MHCRNKKADQSNKTLKHEKPIGIVTKRNL